MLALLFFRGGGGHVASQPGGGEELGTARRYSLRRKKKEFDFLKEIREDLAQEMYDIAAQSSADLTQSTRAELAQNIYRADQKYKKVKSLSDTYQVSIDSIDAAISFADARMQMLLDDEMMIVFTMIAANES